jgi:NAD(P)-dependent dehydrogenase (short-subunit alcohol dehydrogenase family)
MAISQILTLPMSSEDGDCNSQFGAGLVKAFPDRRYNVVANSRHISKSGAFAQSDKLALVDGNIAEPATAAKIAEVAISKFKSIDTLVSNAGVAKPFTSYNEADYAAIMGVNVANSSHMGQLATAQMEKQGHCHVVQVTNSLVDHAIVGVPSVLAALTKRSLNAATKSVAEFAMRNIRVDAVALSIIQDADAFGRRL